MDLNVGLLMLFGVFLMGLGLNLTPCVYPMLSVTVSLFRERRHPDRFHSALRAGVYAFGIIVMYSSLGVIAAFTGGLFGALLQNRWVLTIIAVFFMVLALSLLGLYTFQLPTFLISKIGGHRKVDLFGLFLSGVLVGIFAAPCIGPPVIALLAHVGSIGDPQYGFWVFFVLSLGLGTPYFLLGTFSGLLRHLPKSGTWMVWIEKLFGVALLAFAAFYLILAWKIAFLRWLLPVAFGGGGLYLGFFERSSHYPKAFLWFKRIFGISAVTAAVFLTLHSPQTTTQWGIFDEEKLIAAKEAGRSVILDFYADWCIPCHQLDLFTYSDAKVIEALRGFEKLKVDLTNTEDSRAQKLIERFGIKGVPTILFLDYQGKEVTGARITGFIPPEEFFESIQKLPKDTQFQKPRQFEEADFQRGG